jgi:hypothetical protein
MMVWGQNICCKAAALAATLIGGLLTVLLFISHGRE